MYPLQVLRSDRTLHSIEISGGTAALAQLCESQPVPSPVLALTGIDEDDGVLRPVVATGVQLRIDTGAELSSVYVPLGAAVAQWFMDAYVRACPSNPAGPPAVTARVGG